MDNANDCVKPVYIEQLFKSKNPALAKMIPGFVFAILKRLLHQQDINDFIHRYGDRKGLDFSDAILEYLRVDYRVEGEENLPAPDGRYIFVANHPLGGPDGIILISFLGTRYRSLKFPVNDLLLNLKNLNNIFLPVNKHGAQSREAARAIEAAYASDAQMIMFPAGLVSRKQKGRIKDLAWQKSFITKALQHHRDIVPIYIEGKNSDFFYNLANFRKRIRLKANLEMLFLPSETFKQRDKRFTLRIGRPIPWQQLNDGRKPAEWAETLRETVYALAEGTGGQRQVKGVLIFLSCFFSLFFRNDVSYKWKRAMKRDARDM